MSEAASESGSKVFIRDRREGDSSLIYDSWIRSMADALAVRDPDARAAFWQDMKARIGGILARPEVRVSVVSLPSQPDAVLAWLCYEPRAPMASAAVVHFLVTKKPYRRRSFARALLAQAGLLGTDVVGTFKTWNWPRLEHLFRTCGYVGEDTP